MSDNTSARIFSNIFDLLAKNPTQDKKEMAKEIWKLAFGYDFYPPAHFDPKSMIKLDLAKRGVDPSYPEDGEQVLYEGIDY